jgi:threonine dehydrogenase-like Zn-dependent dehydrogenase
VGTVDPALHPRWNRERRLALAVDVLPSLTLTPLITHRIPFHQAPEAYELVDQHPGETGQVILTYGEGTDY